jgi:formate-dependent nitrite reductase cytochrome c552 subunit
VRTALIVTLLTLLAAIRWVAISVREPVLPEREITYRPVQVEEDGYVSSRTCKACHPSQYETWYGSYHRTMTQLATPGTVRANFDGVHVTGPQDTSVFLERRGNDLWAEFDDPDRHGKGEEAARINRQVVMVTGSHQQQVYWYRTSYNRLLGQLPLMYLVAERRWIPRGAAFMEPPAEPGERGPSETGRWNAVCIDCHATNGKRRLNAPFGSQPIETLVADTNAGEFGISCEACHGPSEQHVNANRSPLRRYWLHLTGRPDPTSVKPTRLSPRLSSQICGQCHATFVLYDRVEGHLDTTGPSYRPGTDLERTHFVLQPTKNIDTATMKKILASDPTTIQDSFWSDGMIRVSGREYNGLIDSPCFKDARDERRTMSCSSCHTMHKAAEDPRSIEAWADTHQVSAGMNGNGACLQCHETLRANLTSHTKHHTDSAGSSCYNCHMPYTSYGLLKALRSHQISSPTAAVSVQTGRPNACNLCHLDKTLAWTSEYLGKWYGTPQIQLDQDERTIVASMLWLLRGDAGQRSLVAWSMGWQPAQHASGTSWMPPSLSLLMNDPYAAVRFIAYRSLRSLPGFAEFNYDFTGPPDQRPVEGMRVMDVWRSSGSFAESRNSPALLLEADGSMKNFVVRLLRQRDLRRFDLRE